MMKIVNLVWDPVQVDGLMVCCKNTSNLDFLCHCGVARIFCVICVGLCTFRFSIYGIHSIIRNIEETLN